MSKHGPPKHQNKFAWNPNAGRKINENEPGGIYRPFPEIAGVCPRCRDQIEWKRKYGKYKPLIEPSKCQKCSKRAVRQAYLNLCPGCAKDKGVCAKCCTRTDQIVARFPEEVEAELRTVEQCIRNSRERERRTMLRLINRDEVKGKKQAKTPTIQEAKVKGLLSAASLEEYTDMNTDDEDNNDYGDDKDYFDYEDDEDDFKIF